MKYFICPILQISFVPFADKFNELESKNLKQELETVQQKGYGILLLET